DAQAVLRVGGVDALLPEADALGQSLPIPRTRQQLEEEVRIMSVKRPQAFRHDLDGRGRGCWSGGERIWATRPTARPQDAIHTLSRMLQEMAEVIGQILGRAVAFRSPLGQGLQANAFQLRGNRLVHVPRV